LHLSAECGNNLNRENNQIIEFTLLFNKYKKRLYNYVLKMCSDRMLSDDIVQDVFLKLYKNLDLIVSRESILFWLFKSARNELYGLYRNTKLQKLYIQTEDFDELEKEDIYSLPDDIELKDLKKLVMKELDKINPDQKEAFILKEYSGLSYREIASLTGSDEELVKSRLYKVRQKLIKRISKHVQ